jgi:hypothetical protein
MKDVILGIMMMGMISIFLNGCGQGSDPNLARLKGYKQPSDTDVTSSHEYNFSSFAGTVWKTKVKVALADLKRYTGRHDTALLAPEDFDAADPKYRPPDDMEMIAVLPVGTRLRIERLMKDNGIGGLLWVTGSLEDGKVVYVECTLLARNRFTSPGLSDSKDWGVDPDLLEKAEGKK